MIENAQDGTVKDTARRRLIRGAFAAPTALTLYSGNVFAAASSSLRALSNQLNDAKFPSPDLPELPGPGETWIRVQVWKLDNTLFVKGDDVLALRFGCGVDRAVFQSGTWTNIATSEIASGISPSATTSYAALRFDSRGVIVGVSSGSPVGSTTALTRSAGASISVVGGCA